MTLQKYEPQTVLDFSDEKNKEERSRQIAIIDADLIGRKKHRFPNLVCMKLSNYLRKEKGKNPVLKLDYDNLEEYEDVKQAINNSSSLFICVDGSLLVW